MNFGKTDFKAALVDLVRPGDGTVTGNLIPAYQNIWEIIAVNPDGSVTAKGIWEDEMTIIQRHGSELLQRVQHVHYSDKKPAIQIDQVDRKTLKHVSLRISNVGEEAHTAIHYHENRIYGKKLFNIDGLDSMQKISASFAFELEEPVFDWHLWGVLISGFPLSEGYHARFLAHESYSYLPGDFRWIRLKVIGQESIDCGKWGTNKCWMVEVNAEVTWKLWIAVDKEIAPVQKICIYYTDGTQFWWYPFKQNSI